jgi:enoyl-CoA hydratase/carnithine racemase
MDDDYERLRVTVEGGVAVAVIDNPPINLMTVPLFRDLARFADAAAADDDVRVVVLRSDTPGFFIAHFDVEAILGFPVDSPPQRAGELGRFHLMTERFRTMPKATICEIAGRVGGGGGELAASCDLRFGAVDRTVLCQMEVPLGILPGGSGTQRLPRLIGRGPALEVILGGDDIDTGTLLRWGWLNRALPPDDLRPFVDAFAARVASFPPVAVAQAKAAALAAEPDPSPGLLDEAYRFQVTLRDPASAERMRRFLDRGGQAPEGEARVGALGGELADP